MRKFLTLCAIIVGIVSANAQTVIDNFTVGPYVVDYNGQGDVKYRLRDNINLYEFFELQKDTTIVADVVETPIRHAIQISGYLGANRYASKEIGISVLWKQQIATNLYFNGGASLAVGHSNFACSSKRNMLEAGIPLQIEFGKLNHQKATIYGAVGVTPTAYATLSVKEWKGDIFVDAPGLKKKGLLVAPILEFGGNIPVGGSIMRIGVYGTYKVNCTKGTYDVYGLSAGRCFLGAKIGIVL